MREWLDRAKTIISSPSVSIDFDSFDVGTRHHDVLHANLAEPQYIVEHRPLARRESGLVGSAFGKCVREVLAQIGAVAMPEEACQPFKQVGRSAAG